MLKRIGYMVLASLLIGLVARGTSAQSSSPDEIVAGSPAELAPEADGASIEPTLESIPDTLLALRADGLGTVHDALDPEAVGRLLPEFVEREGGRAVQIRYEELTPILLDEIARLRRHAAALESRLEDATVRAEPIVRIRIDES